MIIRDVFFESGSTEATKKNMENSDQITVPYLNIETRNRRLNIGGWYVFAGRKG
jgi:glutaredoxin